MSRIPALPAGTTPTSATPDPKSAIRTAARQFEAMFMQQLMKSMRESSLSSGLLDNGGTELGTEMLDGQLAQKMSGLPGGLADVIARQLERQTVGAARPAAAAAGAVARGSLAIDPTDSSGVPAPEASPTQQGFIARHRQAAAAAEAETGIPAGFMVAQAAHESGWGRREIRHADGTSANNLFGIKAGGGWNGPVAEVATTEYIDGAAHKVTAKFRAYASAEESFRDYARLMRSSPRYAAVVASGNDAQGFAVALQRAGYATDPAYAEKLGRVINTTLRLQRASA